MSDDVSALRLKLQERISQLSGKRKKPEDDRRTDAEPRSKRQRPAKKKKTKQKPPTTTAAPSPAASSPSPTALPHHLPPLPLLPLLPPAQRLRSHCRLRALLPPPYPPLL